MMILNQQLSVDGKQDAFYEFADVAQAQALIGSTKMEPLVADFDRVWGNRVSRRREILEIAQEMTS